MPEVIQTHEFRRRSYNRYDWDAWLDGRKWRLTAGIDYHGPASNVVAAAVRNAKQRGTKLLCDVVEENGEPERVIIQAVEETVTP